jgi:PAS domain S-box-containing protein
MPNPLWGVAGFTFSLPERPTAYLLLALYTVFLVRFLLKRKGTFGQMNGRYWLLAGGLAMAGIVFSQLFPIHISSPAPWLDWLIPPQIDVYLTLLVGLPLLLAALLLDTAVAMLVGFAAGLSFAIYGGHELFAPYHFAFVTGLASWLFHQPYKGRLFAWLRHPVLVGVLMMFGLLPLVWLAVFLSTGNGWLTALDWALLVTHSRVLSYLLAGLLAGVMALVVERNIPQARPRQANVPNPAEKSLLVNLTAHFVVYSVGLTVVVLTAVYVLLATLSTQLTVTQMATDADAVLAQIPEFQDRLQTLVIRNQAVTPLAAADRDVSASKLGDIYRLAPEYAQLLLVDDALSVVVAEPAQNALALTPEEETAVAEALSRNVSTFAIPQTPNNAYVVSLITPLATNNNDPKTALIGRIPPETMQSLVTSMQKTVGEGTGFVVSEQGVILAHPDQAQMTQVWPPFSQLTQMHALSVAEAAPGTAYLLRSRDNKGRELAYVARQSGDSWQAVITVPYTTVLKNVLKIGGPLALILLVITAVSAISLRSLSRNITEPMNQLINAAKTVASGGEWESTEQLPLNREDEIGQLGRAFDRMQRSMKQRLNELSLLLGVSHDVATSLDLNEGVPALLRGALRGTGAAGARAVVANPSGGRPLTYGVGPASEKMAWLDRYIASKIREVSELMLSTPAQIQATLNLPPEREVPIPALLAVPLFSQDRFQGVMWLGYRQTHSITLTERNLLRTLAGQATILVENARLFASAEGGRRRLMAVLSSTSDAVIVTDQTERVLLVNPAFEKLFGIDSEKVTGLPLADVIDEQALLDLLRAKNLTVANPEIEMGDRTYYGNASKIVANDGQILGRVAVLHDITRYKEIDEMKSNFVADVSHDLRSPLTFMRGYATMMPMVGELNEQQHDYLDRILGGIEQMSNLVEDLLDLARIEAAVDLDKAPIDPKILLDDIAQEYWQHAHLSGNELEVRVAEGIPAVEGDLPLIRRAVTNLLSNAFKYAPNSGKVGLYAWASNGHVIIKVQDNGPGIPDDLQPRLFEKFYRAKQRGTEKIKGTGLGLAIVKSIAERHGGWVKVDSKVGEGTSFYIALPIAPQNHRNGQLAGQTDSLEDSSSA